jgi:phenylalanyl-tRNA synthetase beta chain
VRAPLSWLREFAPIEGDPRELAGVLDSLGLVVEGVEVVGEGLDDVVLARVVGIDAIPGADRIRRVTVDAGGDMFEVVCGAWNFSEGDLVPFVRAGGSLPGGMAITRRRMKGVESNGMLCSGRELGLSEDGTGLMVLSDTGAAEGTPLVSALGIEREVVFDLAIEANRPDAMSMAGVARDLAAKLGLPFEIPEPSFEESPPRTSELVTVEVEAPGLCPLFSARVLTGVEVGDSPEWMARRLVLSGMRPINSVVDASNYVMLELGQPTHPYDLDRLGGGGLLVRAARPGERLVTLDGAERVLGGRSRDGSPGEDCVICDATGSPVGIGGVMGGTAAEISGSTDRVVLESAYFTPMAIARTSRRLGLRTEASARFERGVDPSGVARASARYCELLLASRPNGSGRTARATSGLVEVSGDVPGPARVRVRMEKVDSLLGVKLGAAEVRRLLEALGFEVAGAVGGDLDALDVVVPARRPDTAREVDVVEEVARLYGYSRIPRSVPERPHLGRLTPYQRERRAIRATLAGLGLSEAWTRSLLGPDDDLRAGIGGEGIEVENPLAREESVLRRSLLPGLLDALLFNLSRRRPAVSLFEIGHVFGWPCPGERLPEEREVLAAALAGPGEGAESAVRTWRALEEVLRLEGVSLVPRPREGMHPSRTAELEAPPGVVLGAVGEVDPEVLSSKGLSEWVERVGWIELDLQRVHEAPRRSGVAAPVSKFPSSDIDLAFVVGEDVPAASVQETLRSAAGELLESLWLFDVYRGDSVGQGVRSLAFRLRFCALDRTLTDAEVAEARRACIEAVESRHGARLRA